MSEVGLLGNEVIQMTQQQHETILSWGANCPCKACKATRAFARLEEIQAEACKKAERTTWAHFGTGAEQVINPPQRDVSNCIAVLSKYEVIFSLMRNIGGFGNGPGDALQFILEATKTITAAPRYESIPL